MSKPDRLQKLLTDLNDIRGIDLDEDLRPAVEGLISKYTDDIIKLEREEFKHLLTHVRTILSTTKDKFRKDHPVVAMFTPKEKSLNQKIVDLFDSLINDVDQGKFRLEE